MYKTLLWLLQGDIVGVARFTPLTLGLATGGVGVVGKGAEGHGQNSAGGKAPNLFRQE